jgi:hypothetical protein
VDSALQDNEELVILWFSGIFAFLLGLIICFNALRMKENYIRIFKMEMNVYIRVLACLGLWTMNLSGSRDSLLYLYTHQVKHCTVKIIILS